MTSSSEYTFHASQDASDASTNQAFVPVLKNAFKHFLADPDVKAITCNVGFCAALQPLAIQAANEVCADLNKSPIPLLLGSPALIPAFTSIPSLAIDTKTEKIMILTSYYP